MKTLVLMLLSFSSVAAHAKDCKENALAAAIQMEATQKEAKDFATPVSAKSISKKDGIETYRVKIKSAGTVVTYFVKVDGKCDVTEEPQKAEKKAEAPSEDSSAI